MPSIALRCAVIMSIALCVSSCRTSKESLFQNRADNLLLKEINTTTYVPVPTNRVAIPLSAESLRNLPEGAGYHKKNGRASLDLRKRGDTIFIEASCDSLQRLVTYYSSELTRSKTETLLKDKETRSNAVWGPFKWLVIGFAAGAATALIYKIKKE